MQAITKIAVDITHQTLGGQVDAIQGDGNTRCVEVMLLENGKPWEVPSDAEVAVAYTKPDNTTGLYNKLADDTPAIMIDGSVVTIVLAHQMLTVPGIVKAGIVINNARLDQLTTFPFTVQVVKNPFAGAEESQDYIRLQWLEDKLAEYISKIGDGSVDEAEIQRIVDAYLAANPPTVILIDDISSQQANLTPTEILQAVADGTVLMAIGGVCTLMEYAADGSWVMLHRQYAEINKVAEIKINADRSYSFSLHTLVVDTAALPNPHPLTINGTSYDGSVPVEMTIDGGSGGIAVTGATVGQTIKIAAVDDNGVPTAWAPVDLPSGVHTYRHIQTITIPDDEEIAALALTIPAKTRRLYVLAYTSSSATFDTQVRVSVMNKNVNLAAYNQNFSMSHRKALFIAELYDDLQFMSAASSNSNFTSSYPGVETHYDYANYFSASDNVFNIYIHSSSTNKYFAAGCEFQLYALCEE